MKKLIAIVLSLALILSAFGASLTVSAETVTYYVSDSGSDSNDGLSAETPLKTIGAVNVLSLSSGAKVLFECGSIWRGETLVCQEGVYYGSYGQGEKPAFYGSYENYAREEYWELTDVSCVYKTTFTIEEDIGAIVFDNGQQIGVRYINNEKPSNLWGNGMFIYSNTDKCVYLRCTSGNPGEIYSDIEFIQHWELIDGNNANNVTIEDITLKYANFGYNALDSQSNITLRGLEIAYIGGRYKSDGSVRLGNGIQFYGNNFSDITVDKCIVTQCYDTAFTCQMYGGRDVSFKNVNVTDCEFSYCYWTVEMWYRPYNEYIDYATISNVNFTGNTFAYAGYGFGSGYPYIADPLRFWNDGANSATLVNNMIFDNYNATPDVNFTDNTFCVSKDYLFYSSYDMDFSGNTYIVDDNTKTGMLGGTTDKTLISELDSLSFEPDAEIKYMGEITSTSSNFAYNVMENGDFETVYGEISEPTEYITNGSFDNDGDGWAVPYGDWSVITDSSTGDKMVKITPYACNLRQLDIELPAGKYVLSFEAKSDNADYTSEVLVDYVNDTNVKVLSTTFDIKSAGFITYTFEFVVETAGKYNVKIGKNGGDPQNKYIDNVSLTECIEPEEFITNGSFDDGTNGWTVPYGDWSIITDSSTGDKMVKITPYACNLRQLDIELPAGTYELSFSAKSDNADYTSEVLVDYANDTTITALSSTFDIKSSGFNTYTFTFEVGTAGKYNVKIGKNGGDPQNKYIDDVSLTVFKENAFEEEKGANLLDEDGWYCESNLIYSTDKIHGERSLNTTSASVEGAFTVRESVPYKLSWWYKGASSVTVTDENGAVLCEKAFSSEDWEYYEYYFTTPENCKRLRITLSGESLYDEFVLSPYPEYNIYEYENGMIAASDKWFVKGENIEFFAYQKKGYSLNSAEACQNVSGSVLSATLTDETDCYTVKTENENIAFCGNFVLGNLYAISVSEDILHATVTIAENAMEGDNVLFTITPENGYVMKEGSLKVYTEEQNIDVTTVSDVEYSFIMPSSNVVVYAEFEYKNSVEKGTIDLITNGDFDDGNNAWTVPYNEGKWGVITDSSNGNSMMKIQAYQSNLRQLDIYLSAGTYVLSFRAKSDDADFSSPVLVDGTATVLSSDFDFKCSGFNTYTFTFEVENAGNYNVKLGGNGSDKYNKYFDDVKLLTTYSVYLDSQEVLMTDDMIYGINEGITPEQLTEKFILENAELKYSTSETIGTGDTVTLVVCNKEIWTKPTSVIGDVNSDGEVNVLDLIVLKKYVVGARQLNFVELQSAKIEDKETVSATSLIALRKMLLNK